MSSIDWQDQLLSYCPSEKKTVYTHPSNKPPEFCSAVNTRSGKVSLLDFSLEVIQFLLTPLKDYVTRANATNHLLPPLLLAALGGWHCIPCRGF